MYERTVRVGLVLTLYCSAEFIRRDGGMDWIRSVEEKAREYVRFSF